MHYIRRFGLREIAEARRRGKEEVERKECNYVIFKMTNELHVSLLRWVLGHPLCAVCENSYEGELLRRLESNCMRILSHNQLRILRQKEKRLADGYPVKLGVWDEAKNKAPERAAWMSDASLLPKRPPGKAAQ